jgi:neutral trehalase
MDLADLEEEAQRLTTYINDAMWDDHAGFYYDRRYNTTHARVVSCPVRVSCRVSRVGAG